MYLTLPTISTSCTQEAKMPVSHYTENVYLLHLVPLGSAVHTNVRVI